MNRVKYIRGIAGLLFFIILTTLSASCQSESESEAHLIYLKRYDKLQSAYILKKDDNAFLKMRKDFPLETSILYENVLSLNDSGKTDMKQAIYQFYANDTFRKVVRDTEKKFADMSVIEDSLNIAFNQLKEELPTLRIPSIYTQISALNQSIIVSDSIVGISLDKYLGEDYPLYARYYYPYQRHTMTPDRIIPDVLFYYLCSEYAGKQQNRSYAEWIVNVGKIQWIVYKILGFKNPGASMGYTREEVEWMENNESKVWYYLINNRFLQKRGTAEHDWMEGDFLKTYFQTNVPAFMPMWMGTRLVGKFMKKNKHLSVFELLDTDYKSIYETAGFAL